MHGLLRRLFLLAGIVLLAWTAALAEGPAQSGTSLSSAERPPQGQAPEAIHAASLKKPHGGGTLVLEDLEPRVVAAPEVLIADADIEAARAALEREQARAGWELFGSAGTGYYQEPVDEGVVRDYSRAQIVGGLSYPLLGTRASQEMRIAEAQAGLEEQELVRELERRRSVTALRKQYAIYYAAHRQASLSRAFLRDRHAVEERLAQRHAKGLLLESDRQAFLSGFYLARRNKARAEARKSRSLQKMRLLTDSRLQPLPPAQPELPGMPDLSLSTLRRRVLEGFPEIALLRSRVTQAVKQRQIPDRVDVQSDVQISTSASREYPDGETGASLFVGLNVRLPADAGRVQDAVEESRRAQVSRARMELRKRSREVLIEAEYHAHRCTAARKHVEFARQRVLAALDALREMNLTSGRLPGDVFEQLQQARLRYYQSAMDLIEAQADLLQQRASLLHYLGPEDGDREEAATSRDLLHPELLAAAAGGIQADRVQASGSGRLPTLGFYVWDSTMLSDNADNSGMWAFFRDLGAKRLLVSFDRQGLRRLEAEKGAWSELISRAGEQGIGIELLLAEPTWILPAHRDDLLGILRDVPRLSFDALHLDLEPNQLSSQEHDPDVLVQHLVHTLQAAQEISPWPVGLSIHPGYALGRRTADFCLGCALSRLQLREVALMAYTTSTKTSVDMLRTLKHRFPEVRWTLAQSFETMLPERNSWASRPRSAFQEHIRTIRREVQEPRLPVLIQSLRELLKQYESPF